MRRDSVRRQSARRSAIRRGAGIAALGLALPLAACTAPHPERIDLVSAGCPSEIRIDTDALPGVEWGFLYRLLDADAYRLRGGDEVRAPLVVDGQPTGVTLTILVGRDPADGVSANTHLYEQDDLLLAAVDTDRAVLDAVRYPTVGVFAPLARDTHLLYWDANAYGGVRDIERLGRTLTPDGSTLAPVAVRPHDPFVAYAIGMGWLSPDQVVTDAELTVPAFVAAGGIRAQSGDALIDPYLLELPGDSASPFRTQLTDDTGYTRDSGVLSARPQTIVRHADCLTELVPILQQSLVDYIADPDPTNALLVDLTTRMHHPELDAAFVANAFEVLIDERFVGNGRDTTIGDLDIGRVRQLFEKAIPEWEDAEVAVPSGIEPDDIFTTQFIDSTIGL